MFPKDLRPDAGDADRTALLAMLARQEAEIDGLCAEVLARYEEATFVYRLSEQIGAARGEREIAGLLIREAASVFGAETADLWLRDEARLTRAAWIPDRPAVEPTAAVRETIATGRTIVKEPSGDDRAQATVPLPDGQGSFLGALVLYGRHGGRPYLTGDIKLLSAISALAGSFIRNERLAVQAREAEARKRESEIAREIHRGLLPRHDPRFEGLDVSGGFKAADGLGGDYYGYTPMADGGLGIAIADVSGHGVGAALYMAIAKGALENEARETLSAGAILGRVNEILTSEFRGTDMFTTAAFARFLPGARRLVWSNAGHNPPLLIRANGDLESLKPCGPALGLVSHVRWDDVETRFDVGDALVLYTDGVVEARDSGQAFFGMAGLIEAARRPGKAAAGVRDRVLDALTAHLGGTPTRDDVTLVVIRGVTAEGPP